MCGRYNFTAEESAEINNIIKTVNDKFYGQAYKTGEIYPTNTVPVLVNENESLVPELCTWGYPNFRNKGVIINARAETVTEKKMFRDSVLFRRCVIPTSGFYEWKQDSSKQKYLFRSPESMALYLAGFYNTFKSETRFVILTTAPNESMQDIHNRMPVVLDKPELSGWVQDTDRAMEILRETPMQLTKTAV